VIDDFLQKLRASRAVTDDDKHAIVKNIERLMGLTTYPFTALEISHTVIEEVVSNIFVRINSEGVQLKQADFILTLLSVFWDEGRAALETFARKGRRPPGPGEGASPFNHLIQAGPDQLLRVAVAHGFHRARLKSVYQILRGKNLDTGTFSEEHRQQQFAKLRVAQEQVLDLKHWHLFLGAILGAGFRSAELISSHTALLYSYALYLVGKLQCGLDEHRLQRVIGRWFFASTLTGRYSNSPESEMEADLARVKDLRTGDQFVEMLESAMASALTNDFWAITFFDRSRISPASSICLATFASSPRCDSSSSEAVSFKAPPASAASSFCTVFPSMPLSITSLKRSRRTELMEPSSRWMMSTFSTSFLRTMSSARSE
jgi:hypothetical protein